MQAAVNICVEAAALRHATVIVNGGRRWLQNESAELVRLLNASVVEL